MSSDPDTAKKRLAFQKGYSQEHGYTWFRRSLIEDAKFDTVTNAEFVRIGRQAGLNTTQSISFEDSSSVLDTVENGEEVHLPNRSCSLIITLRDMMALSRVFKLFENNRASIKHVETRRGREKNKLHDVLVLFDIPHDKVSVLGKSLSQHSSITDVRLITDQEKTEEIWFPRLITDLDKCQHLLTKFDPDLDQDHPGFSDIKYRERRSKIVEIAFNYKHGQSIPRVEYSEDEKATWTEVYRKLKTLYPTHACQEHLTALKLLESGCGYSEDNIPQLEDVSQFLRKQSGFQLRPVAGLLSARDFLSSLAFRVFQCTQYLRHGSSPHHTVEPDCAHELLGHVPMLCNPEFAQFSQEIGLASIGASDEDIEKIATIYWFTVEFGLCKQAGEVRAYGAGLLSAFGELNYSLTDSPEKKPFDPETTALQKYDDQNYQTTYFICESFEIMKEKVRKFAAKIQKPFELRYDPYTQSLQVLDNTRVIQDITTVLHTELNCISNALQRLSIGAK